jgi:molecular chaperone GrpE
LSVVGEPFDPQRHEAIAQVESSQHPPNTVLEEHHRGYLIGDRMLRPARVSVAKPGGDNRDKNGKSGDPDIENN